MDSTFISLQPYEQHLNEQSLEQALFDRTLDNMSMQEDGNGGPLVSELLRAKCLGSRSRFISDESFFAGGGLSSDIPDKSFENQPEETKTARSSPTDRHAPSRFFTPIDRLGIPIFDDSSDLPCDKPLREALNPEDSQTASFGVMSLNRLDEPRLIDFSLP